MIWWQTKFPRWQSPRHTMIQWLHGPKITTIWWYQIRSDPVRFRQDELYDVVDIAASDLSFAAWRADGRVVTWGNRSNGGDSLAVQMQLKSLRNLRIEIQTWDPNISKWSNGFKWNQTIKHHQTSGTKKTGLNGINWWTIIIRTTMKSLDLTIEQGTKSTNG